MTHKDKFWHSSGCHVRNEYALVCNLRGHRSKLVDSAFRSNKPKSTQRLCIAFSLKHRPHVLQLLLKKETFSYQAELQLQGIWHPLLASVNTWHLNLYTYPHKTYMHTWYIHTYIHDTYINVFVVFMRSVMTENRVDPAFENLSILIYMVNAFLGCWSNGDVKKSHPRHKCHHMTRLLYPWACTQRIPYLLIDIFSSHIYCGFTCKDSCPSSDE